MLIMVCVINSKNHKITYTCRDKKLLRNLRKLVLATQEPNKIYTGKKKIREMIQAKRTIK